MNNSQIIEVPGYKTYTILEVPPPDESLIEIPLSIL